MNSFTLIKLRNAFFKSIVHGESVDDCWKFIGDKAHNGYGQLHVKEGSKTINKRAHKLSYELHIGDVPKGLLVLHDCDNPECCNPRHLKLGTQSDNIKEMYAKQRNTSPVGERHPNSKLTIDKVTYIWSQRKIKRPETLATELSVSVNTIRAIWNRANWKHLTDTL